MTVEEMIKKTEHSCDDSDFICVYAIGNEDKIFTINKITYYNQIKVFHWCVNVVNFFGDCNCLKSYDSIDEAYNLIKQLTYDFDTVYVNSYSLERKKQE